MSSMTIRVGEQEKVAAAAVAEFYGFDLSSVTRAFWKQMVRSNSIPLDLTSEEPNDASLVALAESHKMFASNESRFDNVEDMIASLKS